MLYGILQSDIYQARFLHGLFPDTDGKVVICVYYRIDHSTDIIIGRHYCFTMPQYGNAFKSAKMPIAFSGAISFRADYGGRILCLSQGL